jgi:hypothetical protein
MSWNIVKQAGLHIALAATALVSQSYPEGFSANQRYALERLASFGGMRSVYKYVQNNPNSGSCIFFGRTGYVLVTVTKESGEPTGISLKSTDVMFAPTNSQKEPFVDPARIARGVFAWDPDKRIPSQPVGINLSIQDQP